MAKAIYVGVDGKARRASHVYVGVDGVTREIKKAYVGDASGKARLCYETESVMAIGELAIGDSVFLNVGGKPYEFLVVHQGLPSDSYAESCNGTWLLMKNVYDNREWDSNGGADYENSSIHEYLNSEFLTLFDTNIQNAIKIVQIPYTTGGFSVRSGFEGLPCKIFLLSASEVALSGLSGYNLHEGNVLGYFEGLYETDVRRVANKEDHTSGYSWWLRTPYNGSAACYIFYDGSGTSAGTSGTSSIYTRPALILPQETRLPAKFNHYNAGLFTFTISQSGSTPVTCWAAEGMTWREWCDSEYNVFNYYVLDAENAVYRNDNYTYYLSDNRLNGNKINASDRIEHDALYFEIRMSSSAI